MRADPIVERLDDLDEACLEMVRRLESLRTATARIRLLREAGEPVSRIVAVGPGAPARRQVRESWSLLNRALHTYREQLVRSMVDDEGLNIADVARVTGNARQVVSRLYHGIQLPTEG
jgi:hypothetical protein